MKMKSLVGLASLMVAIVNCSAEAAVVLNSHTGPTATFNTTVNFTTEGTYDWVYYAGAKTGSTIKSAAGNEKSGRSLFSNISIVGPTERTYLNIGAVNPALYGCTITFSDGVSPVALAGSANSIYARYGVANDGLSFTYNLAANSSQMIKVYLQGYNQGGILSLNSASSGSLYADANSVVLPPSGNGTGGNPGNTAGVYSFNVTNDSDAADTLTFTYIMGAAGGSVSVQGVTVSEIAAVPEIASVGILGLGALALSARRRKIV